MAQEISADDGLVELCDEESALESSPQVLFTELSATNISQDVFSGRPVTLVRGTMQRSELVLIRYFTFVNLSATNRRLDLRPALSDALIAGPRRLSSSLYLYGGLHFVDRSLNIYQQQQIFVPVEVQGCRLLLSMFDLDHRRGPALGRR